MTLEDTLRSFRQEKKEKSIYKFHIANHWKHNSTRANMDDGENKFSGQSFRDVRSFMHQYWPESPFQGN